MQSDYTVFHSIKPFSCMRRPTCLKLRTIFHGMAPAISAFRAINASTHTWRTDEKLSKGNGAALFSSRFVRSWPTERAQPSHLLRIVNHYNETFAISICNAEIINPPIAHTGGVQHKSVCMIHGFHVVVLFLLGNDFMVQFRSEISSVESF